MEDEQRKHNEEEFDTTFFPRRDRSNTQYYGKSNTNHTPMTHKKIETKYRPEQNEIIQSRLDIIHKQDYDNNRNNAMPKRKAVKKRTARKKNKKNWVFATVVAVVAVMGISVGVVLQKCKDTSQQEPVLTGETIAVTIHSGETTSDVAATLKECGIIDSAFLFRLSSKLNGYDGTFQSGTYDIDTGLTDTQIMAMFKEGRIREQQKLTIPEGYTVKQIAQKVEEQGVCTAEEFIQEVNTGTFTYDFLNGIPEREYRLEGYLFPDTYFIYEDTTAYDIITMMLNRFAQMYTAEYQQAVENSGYTLDEIVTIASMVEKEIKVPEERAIAAGVIYNRLAQDMSLGIDATVLYAVGKTAGELTQSDLQTDSPYNTRLHKGLPLGPIANAGESAFVAALYPEQHKYLYYVVEQAGADNHVFCETYDEFLTAKQKYQDSL